MHDRRSRRSISCRKQLLISVWIVLSSTNKCCLWARTLRIVLTPVRLCDDSVTVFSLIVQVDYAIDTMVSELENTISLLRTIPGVARNSAITVISEIGNDMSRFDPSKRLCCWAGLTPGNNESAGKKKSVRITHAGVYLKPALAQVTHPVVKATGISYYRLIKILFKNSFTHCFFYWTMI